MVAVKYLIDDEVELDELYNVVIIYYRRIPVLKYEIDDEVKLNDEIVVLVI